ncbi:beta-galactosidase [Streptomyces sp. SAT1]|uniref:glycoside hydrolase family 35 protein n=1 Tax=Streptomyces sp. SAT1 TaxID=1849967 RepID=UPI0007DD5C12|nr:beta-galactosidase [Streptomyces sp. SAT1]ANH91376.1 beta-galactosidase [Streptomyces sp. SAT1]
MALSRRTFSALAGSAALGLALGGSGGPGAPAAFAAHGVPTGPPPPVPAADGRRHTVAFDHYSLLVDGRRLVLWSGEMHPFRLPSPGLWRDVLQKMRAHGYNAVTARVAWNYHSAAPGAYDFTGVRDLGLFLRTAAETGLYVVLRPGPRIGADVDGGGLPGWLPAAAGASPTADPGYARHAEEWLGRVDAIAARHLYTRGDGTVLLYQVDSGAAADTGGALVSRLLDKVRADGIDVPLFHGDRGGRWMPQSFPRPAGFLSDTGGGHGTGAPRARDAAAVRRAQLTDLAGGIALHNVYPAFGGTSWGWLPGPGMPASYDHGAAIDEGRQVTAEMVPAHQIGHMLRHLPDFAKLERAGGASARGLTTYHLRNPDTGGRVHILRNDSDKDVSSLLPAAGEDLPVTVPARDARLAVTGMRLGLLRVRYSTAHPMLYLSAGPLDIVVFCGRRGDSARLALEAAGEPMVTRLSQQVAYVYERRLVRITVPFGTGLAGARVEAGETVDRPVLMLFADDRTSSRLWPYETPSGSLLVCGPRLLRTAAVQGATLHLTGDTVEATRLEVWPPHGVTAVTWNGRPVRTVRTGSGSLRSVAPLAGVAKVELPVLGGWRARAESPESAPGFDDSAWRTADLASADGGTAGARKQPVLSADAYGFHYGAVWYRGAFTDASGIGSVSLEHGAGPGGLLMAWLDGEPLGTHQVPGPGHEGGADAGHKGGADAGTAVLAVPPHLRTGGRHVLAVLVRPAARAQDDTAPGTAAGAARGLAAVDFAGGEPRVRWRIQGAGPADPVRGPLNNGGLHGEREGWHLPGFLDGGWDKVSFPRAVRRQGVTWYRTTFKPSVAAGTDASVGLVLDDDPHREWRAQVFLNGWNLGEYVNGAAGRRPLVLPDGILRTRDTNTLALAVLSGADTEAGPGRVRLTLLGSAAGGVPVVPVSSPGR